MRSRTLAVLAGALVLSASCAPALFVPPSGPGIPAPDAAGLWESASRTCRATSSFLGSLRISGSVGGDRLPTTIVIDTGATSSALDLEAHAAGRSVFRLVGTTDEATIYLDDGHRFAKASPEALTEALVGVKLGPARWLALLTGCLVAPADFVSAERYGPELAVTTAGGRVFLDPVDTGWRAVHGVFDGLIVTYEQFSAAASSAASPGLPLTWRLTSAPGRDPSVALAVRVASGTAGASVPATAFRLTLPNDAVPMTLDELRESGPLRKKG